MARAPLQADFAAFVDATVVPALRALRLPVGDVADPLYFKLISAAFVPLAVVFLLVAIVRGRFTLHRFLGLYIVLLLVAFASGWLNYRVVQTDAGSFSLDNTVFSYEKVPLEAILHHVFAALLLASVHFALQRPGHSRYLAGSATYLRLWGAGTCALLYGYAHHFLPHRQFLTVRLIAALAYPVLGAQYLLAGNLMLENSLKGIATSLTAILPTVYSLLSVAAAHQLGFVRLNVDSVLGYRYLGVPVELLASYILLSTVVIQGLHIWDGLSAPTHRHHAPAPRSAEPKAHLSIMAKQSPAKGTPQKASNSDKQAHAAASPKTGAAKPSPQATVDQSPASPSATGSPNTKAKNSPQPKKKAAQ